MVVQRSLNDKLASALPYHYREARVYRESALELKRDYAGRTTYPAYKDTLDVDAREKQIVNLTMQSCEAFVMNLAASRPRFSVSSRYAQYEDFAQKMQRALDRYAEELYLEEQLQEIARDSFGLVGVAKVYQASSAAVGLEVDYRMDPGRPFLKRMSVDRLVWDTGSTSPEDVSFIGDYYSMPFRQAIRTRRFSQSVRQQIRDMGPENYQADADKGEDLAKSQNAESVEDLIYLVDVWVRQPKKIGDKRYASHIRTYVCDRNLNLKLNDQPVQIIGWEGEECGPYYFLNMGPVPDHFMPSSPGQNQRLLQQFYNTLYRKLEDQARRMKIVGTAAKGSGDHEIARDARDGEWVEFTEPQAVSNIRLDGPDQNIMGLMIHTGEQHSQAAGNLKAKLGLAQTADTATQERMIGAMVSRLEAFYQQRYVSFVRKAARGLAKLIFHDASLTIPGKFTVPGVSFGLDVPDDFLPYGELHEDGSPSREGEYDYYRVDIDPYSMGYQSPGEKAAFIDSQVTKLMPAMPFLAQLGVQFDPNVYFDEMANLTNTPVLRKLFKTNQAPMAPEGGGGQDMPSTGGPNGQYTHTSQSTRSPESEAMQMFQAPQQEGAAA